MITLGSKCRLKASGESGQTMTPKQSLRLHYLFIDNVLRHSSYITRMHNLASSFRYTGPSLQEFYRGLQMPRTRRLSEISSSCLRLEGEEWYIQNHLLHLVVIDVTLLWSELGGGSTMRMRIAAGFFLKFFYFSPSTSGMTDD